MKKLKWHEVESTALSAIAYQDGTLYCKFTSGRYYYYRKCPIQKFNALLGANRSKDGSVGRTFHIQVRTVLTGVEMPQGEFAVPE